MQKGKKPKTQFMEQRVGFMPYIDIKAFERHIIDSFTDGIGCVFCDEGDLLIVCDGSRSGLVGRAIKGAIGSTLAKIITASFVNSKFLFYFIQSHYVELNTNTKGTGTPHINQTLLGPLLFPIVPLAEQRRIVAKIDALFSRLDKGVETLQIIQQQLQTYRQAVLKWAFEGKLTHSTWKISLLGKVAAEIKIGPFGTLLHKEDYIKSGIPVINPKHMREYKICNDDLISITKDKASELQSYIIYENDVLIARRGEMGRTVYVTEKENGWICGTGSMIVRFPKGYLGKLYAYLLSAEQARKYLTDNCNGTTMSNLNEKIIKSLPIPIISIEEQSVIVSAIESRLSVCDKLEAIVNENLNKAQALKQSILKKAFSGQLVPQDPNDEPASVLLERIKKTTSAKQKMSRTRGR